MAFLSKSVIYHNRVGLVFDLKIKKRVFCLRCTPQAYKPLFISSEVQKVRKLTNNLKK